MNHKHNNTSEIEEEITILLTELYDTLANIKEDSDEINEHILIDKYTKHVTRIGFKLGTTDYKGLREFCVIFHDILNSLFKRQSKITPEEYELCELWPTLILSYLSAPEDEDISEQLVNFIQNPVWEYHPDGEDVLQLKNDLQINTHKENDSTSKLDDEDVNAFDGVVLESIQQEILEAMSDLLADLDSSEPDDDFGISHSLTLCADRIELLGMSIATTGLIGLMDVCILFQTGLRVLSNRNQPVTTEERSIIEEWPTHLITYLASPEDAEVTDNLVNYLASIPWLEAMSDNEKITLKSMLTAEDIIVTALEDNENEKEKHNTHHQEMVSCSETQTFESEILKPTIIQPTADIYYPGQELVQLIRDEFELEKSSLMHALSGFSADDNMPDEFYDQLNLYKIIIERFSLATESIGLSGLNKVLVYLNSNLKDIITNKKQINQTIHNYLENFPGYSLDYLSDMNNESVIFNIVEPLSSSVWPVTFEYTKPDLKNELLSPILVIEDDIEIRATQATINDVSLTLPDDVNQQLLDSLLQELPVQTAEFSNAITQLIEGNAQMHDVEKAQRIAHTLKGAANTVGVTGIATLTHHIEDIFDAFTKHQRLPGRKLAESLMNAADVLETMSETLLGQCEAPEQAQEVLQQILDWANLIDNDGIPEEDTEIQITQTTSENISKPDDTSHLKDASSAAMLRVPASLMDNLLRLAGESIILSGQLQERLHHAEHKTLLALKQNELYQQLVFELEQIVDIQGLTAKKADSKLNDVFDSLELEQYNELHTVTHRLVEAATDSKELTQSIEDELTELNSLLVDQSRLHKENQEIVMQTRMIPVQNIVPRLQRSIRQTCRFTNKKANLNVEGSQTLMDSDVLDELLDPIMHIMRNSIDHGIEDEKTRSIKNKPAAGNINLSFSRDGDHVVVRCVDDGAGLDFDAIRASAINKNIITQDTKLTDEELIRFIWLTGFTTREETTQVSGRGIGMDAVYNKITSLKGELSISSVKDIGCTVELRLPLTLISVHAILVKQRKQTLAISNRGIEQILSPGDGELILKNNSYKYYYNDEIFDAFDVEILLHQPREQQNDSEKRTVLIVRDESGNKIAITVEKVIGNQDLVVKQLGTYIPDIAGIEGATILGNGSVAPVLDLPGLVRTVSNKEIEHIIGKLSENEETPDNVVALIVDDSLSARRSLAEFIKDLGYEVRMARDGIEAIESIDSKIPDIVLVDLEMPRMNGLELTSHLRSKSDTREIPIIMITSRSTEKHREMADSAGVNSYITKPFSEDQLSENIQNLLLTVH